MDRYFELVKAYIRDNALKMLKEEDGVFPHPFIDPGAGYENNLWDWDSYWSAYALYGYCEYFKGRDGFDYEGTRAKVIAHAKGNLLNFFDLQEKDGFIAMVTTAHGLFSSLLKDEHRKGCKVNQHKPFLCKGVYNVSRYAGDFEWFDTEPLERYLKFYEDNQYDGKSGLFFWRNDQMIGMDNNPTVFGFPEDSVADIYLNSFLYTEYVAMEKILCERGQDGSVWALKAEQLKESIRRELYDVRDDLYYSGYIDVKTRKTEIFHHGLGVFWNSVPIKIRIWACFLPVMCGIATPEEGMRMMQKHYTDPAFCCEYGIRTLAKDEKMYNTEKSSNPSNWLGAVWIVANYCTYRALLACGMRDEARKMIEKTVLVLGKDIEKNGAMSESYVPETGEPMMYGGFLNWDVLVIEMIGDYENGRTERLF